MLALYKLNEVMFDARVVYPFMVFNYETENYECRKNSFMKFNPFEKNKNYKMFDETGFYRSTINNVSQYFLAFDQMLRQFLLNDIERDIWIFAMYYDFMSWNHCTKRSGTTGTRKFIWITVFWKKFQQGC